MRIEISPHVANDQEAHRWLDRIVHKIEDGWHILDTTDQRNHENLESTTWIRSRGIHGEWLRQILVASIQRDAWTIGPHGRALRVTAAPGSSCEFNAEDACRLAEEPLWILVENRNSDRVFVERVVKELDPSLQGTWDQPGCPIRFDSVGGKGEMSKEVERRTRAARYRPRLVVIVDSDREAPGVQPSKEASRLHRICRNHNLPCWILEKREAENYLPRTLLLGRPDSGPDHQQRVHAWDRLTDDQKNFLDMKDGLRKTVSSAGQHLFAGLSATDQQTLFHGFGPKVHVCWTVSKVSVKTELSVRGQGDLERGLELIRSEV